jgi:hypothetical protein
MIKHKLNILILLILLTSLYPFPISANSVDEGVRIPLSAISRDGGYFLTQSTEIQSNPYPVETTPYYAIGQEVIEKRTETSKTYYLGKVGNDDKYVTAFYTGIIHYKDNYADNEERWKDIDLTMVNGVVDKTPYILTVDGLNVSIIDKKTGSEVNLKLDEVGTVGTKIAKPTLNKAVKGKATASNIATDTDLEISWGLSSVSYSRILKSASAPITAKYNITQTGTGLVVTTKAIDSKSDINKSVPVTSSINNGVLTESVDTSKYTLTYPVKIDPTTTVYYTSASDGYLWNYDTTYSVSQSGASSDYKLASEYVNVMGQVHAAGYDIQRILLYFDTSGLPDDATISSGTLGLYGASTNPAAEFNITVMSGMPTYPHDPMVEADFDITHYTNGGGTLLTTGLSDGIYNNLTLSSTGRGWVNKTGVTKFALLSDRDIGEEVPWGYENIGFYSYEQGAGYIPFLELTYTVPETATVETHTPATSIEATTAYVEGHVTADGGASVTDRGICYSTSTNPTTASDHVHNGNGLGTFNTQLTGLSAGTTYHTKAFAINSVGTAYGAEVDFLTKPAAPTGVSATENSATNVTVSWTASTGATNYYVLRDAVSISAGNVTSYADTGATAPLITVGTTVASDGTSATQTSLSLSGTSVANGTTYTYKVKANNSSGNSTDSSTDTGYRLATALSYQWQRSSGTGDSGYGDIGGATASTYNDTAAPAPAITAGAAVAADGSSSENTGLSLSGTSVADGAGRYYKCTLTSAGASNTPTASVSNSGYRGATALTYQWYRSSGTGDSGYSTIAGATASTYSDTAAPAPTVTAGTASASDGTSTDYVTLSIAGETGVNGAARYYLCNLVSTGASNTPSNTTTNSGYRGTTTLTYQWLRSASDSDASYSTIAGGTTDPYNDTGAPSDGSTRYFKSTVSMVGASSSNTTANSGYRISTAIPTVVTLSAANINTTTVTLTGNITVATSNATARGFAWGTVSNTTAPSSNQAPPASYTSSNVTTGSYPVGSYTYNGTGLTAGTTYYYRAAANITAGYGWGDQVSFITKPAAPTNVGATDGTSTTEVTVNWTKSTGATDYTVFRDAVDLGWQGDVDHIHDTGAAAPTITAGAAAATDGTSAAHVTLSNSGESASNGTTYTYKVVAKNSSGNSTDSSTNTGYRGTTTLTYDWLRSAGDSDASYSSTGGTTDPYNDTTAPSNGEARYYKATISMTGATPVTSTANRGYRLAIPTVTTQLPTNVNTTGATLNGNITVTNPNATHRGFAWGTTGNATTPSSNQAPPASYTNSNITTGNYSTGTFSDIRTGLTGASTYYYRAAANNTNGWAWGDQRTFDTTLYLTSWTYRKSITVTNATANYQTKVIVGYNSTAVGENVDCNSHCQTDFDDLRFTGSDGSTLLDYWVESMNTTAAYYSATVWVQNDATPSTTIYMYYGNAGASSLTSGVNTFGTGNFDNFEWGANGDHLHSSGGNITWTDGVGVATISTAKSYTGISTDTRSEINTGTILPVCSLTAGTDYAIRMRMYKDTASAIGDYLVQGNGAKAIYLNADASENMRYFDGTYKDTTLDVLSDAWSLIEVYNINWTSGTYTLAIDGATKTGLAMYTTASYANTVWLGNDAASTSTYVDNVIFRKWQATEPTYSAFGGEELMGPTVTTQAATSVEETTATGNGNLIDDAGRTIAELGIAYCLETDGTPTIANSVAVAAGTGEGNFTASVIGLTGGTAYHFVAYVTDSSSITSYGSVVDVLTKPAAPTNVAATDGTSTGNVTITWTKSTGATGYIVLRDTTEIGAWLGDVANTTDSGGAAATITTGNATASDGTSTLHVVLTGVGQGSTAGTTYAYKVKAKNATGNSTYSSTDNGYRGTTTLTYQWMRSAADSDAAYSVIAGGTTNPYNDTAAPVDGSGRYFKATISMTDATSGNTTADRGYRIGTAIPTVVTSAASSVEATTVTLNGNITVTSPNSTQRGFAWGTTSNVTAPSSTEAPPASYASSNITTGDYAAGTFSSARTGLTAGTTYYYRAAANNTMGWGWGDQVSFLTKPAAPTNVAATDGVFTTKVTVNWTKSTGATGYRVYEGVNLLDTLGDVATYDDTTAPAPTITAGNASATDGMSIDHVTLSVAGESAANGASRTYKVVAVNAAGDSVDSATDTGYRGTTTLTYQWQRSAADSDAGYGDIGGGTTDPYNDTAAPADGSGRYFKCVISMTGASNATTSADRGYRAAIITITTSAATGISSTTATLNGEIVVASPNATKRGFAWGTTSNATLPGSNEAPPASYASSNITTGDYAAGTFTDARSGLSTGVTYYYRATANNTAGWGWGDEVSFITVPAAPTGVSATDGTSGSNVTITWNYSTGATGYKVYEGINLLVTLGNVSSYTDLLADAPTITVGAITASDGTSALHVTLTSVGEVGVDGAPRTYKVVATNAGGDSADSLTDTGYRGDSALTYQWVRSAGDSDAAYGAIGSGTTNPYNDTGAPADGSGRYYKVYIYMSGATPVVSAPDRGNRAAPPTVVTGACSGFTSFTAILNGMVTVQGSNPTSQYGFDYGLTAAYGSEQLKVANTPNGVNYWENLVSLAPASVYHYRAKAFNGVWGYGEDAIFNAKGSPVAYELLNTGQDSNITAIYGNTWGYMQFTVGTISHTATKLNLYIKRVGLPSTVTVSLMHATGGLPTGLDLVSTTFDGDAISTGYQMYSFSITETSLQAGEQYAIVVRALGGDVANNILWGTDGGGGLASAISGTSINGGLSYVAAGTADALFEVWGNPDIEVLSAKVYSGYKTAGDWLIVADVNNIYEPYYPNTDPQLYFQLQLINGATIKASSTFKAWQRQPLAIYLNPATAGTLTWGSGYKVRIQSMLTPAVYQEYALVASDWNAGSLLYLDGYLLNLAGVYETYYSTKTNTEVLYLVNTATGGKVLNIDGATMFVRGIPDLNVIRKNLFEANTAVNQIPAKTFTHAGESSIVWSDQVGPKIAAVLTEGGSFVGIGGKDTLNYIFLIIAVVLAIILGAGGNFGGAMLAALPIIGIDIWLGGFSIEDAAAIALIAVFFIIRAIIWNNSAS